MKNLANCKPSEFLRQTNRIRKSAETWLKVTEILEIRKTLPEIPNDIPKDERKTAVEEQGRENFSRILDAILEKHPDETLELLALTCFVEPDDVDNHPVSEYLESIGEMLADKAVIGFFTSLMRLARMNTSMG